MALLPSSKRFTLIKGGAVVDPASKLHGNHRDILVDGDRIVEVAENLSGTIPKEELSVFDASDCIVSPGLVDLHVHCYPGGTVLGASPDDYCLRRGVTTVVDAGSAGAMTFDGFKAFCDTQAINILCFIHASKIGLSKAGCSGYGLGGELDNLDDVDETLCLKCIESNTDRVVGIKIRLSDDIANEGKHEAEAFRRALSISKTAGLPLMVHHSFSTVPLGSCDKDTLSCPGSLKPGDIYTHVFHGYKCSVVSAVSYPPVIDAAVIDAKHRGVLFDVGHGRGSFTWSVAEVCAAHGFWPDTISTDMHIENISGPMYDLPTVMTRMLHLGMPLVDTIQAVTSTPAAAVGREHEIGSLAVGRLADITVLKLVDCDALLEDCQSQARRVRKRLVPVAVWRKGCKVDVVPPTEWPNTDEQYLRRQAMDWGKLVVRDEIKPPYAE